jgi:hypothetical protein
MPIQLANYEQKAKEAIQSFWGNRGAALKNQQQAGKIDAGMRGSVTAGKNMDGFVTLIADVIEANGLPVSSIHRQRRLVTLPGYFRPTKLWDILVVHEGKLIAALELKSQVGSFGNNFNNRTEEAIGSAHDLWTAYREGAFGKQDRPFVGWLMLVEDAPGSKSPVKDVSVHFPVFPEFRNASYLDRYNILCQRLIKEQLYTNASLLASPATAIDDGSYRELDQMTGLKSFITSLAGHIATEAARLK